MSNTMIKKPVKFSPYVGTLSMTVTIAAAGFCIYRHRGTAPGLIYTICVLFGLIALCALFYTPLWISVDDREVRIRRPLRSKTIPLSEIESVKACPPTMAARRLCGSGGWCGYWGWFSERDLGKYFAYYGKASDCFLLTLKNDRKYMLGCDDPQSVIDYINSHIR